MRNQTNYDEDLFLLKNLLRFWTEAVQIPADPDYFSEKLLEDLDFIESILARLQEAVETNTKLIRRMEIIHDLLGTRHLFLRLIGLILAAESPLCSSLEEHRGRLSSMQERQNGACGVLDRELRKNSGEEEDDEDLITPMEMEFLLKKEAEE